jgi:hypothetical protein
MTEGPPQEAPDADRALLELQTDVLALVDETLIRSESVDNGKTVTPTTRREDKLGRRLRRSMMFAVVRKS